MAPKVKAYVVNPSGAKKRHQKKKGTPKKHHRVNPLQAIVLGGNPRRSHMAKRRHHKKSTNPKRHRRSHNKRHSMARRNPFESGLLNTLPGLAVGAIVNGAVTSIVPGLLVKTGGVLHLAAEAAIGLVIPYFTGGKYPNVYKGALAGYALQLTGDILDFFGVNFYGPPSYNVPGMSPGAGSFNLRRSAPLPTGGFETFTGKKQMALPAGTKGAPVTPATAAGLGWNPGYARRYGV